MLYTWILQRLSDFRRMFATQLHLSFNKAPPAKLHGDKLHYLHNYKNVLNKIARIR